MREYKSWLHQVEEGQETLKGTRLLIPYLTIFLDFGINKKVVLTQVEHLEIKDKTGSLEYRGRSRRGSLSSHVQ